MRQSKTHKEVPSKKWGTKEPGLSSACQQRGWHDVSNDLIEKGTLNWSCKVLIQQLKNAEGTETQMHKKYRRLGKQSARSSLDLSPLGKQ